MNLKSVIDGTRAFLPKSLDQKSGHIVNISIMDDFPGIRTRLPDNASVLTVRSFTEEVARELKHSGSYTTSVLLVCIRVNHAQSRRFIRKNDLNENEKVMLQLPERALRMSPEQAAVVILRGVGKRKQRICVGFDSNLMDLLQRIIPVSYGKILRVLGA